MNSPSPKIILLFSGKRKCGKDYITDHLQKLLGDQSEVLKISQPIKSHWAKEKNLNLNEMMSEGAYKEQYRKEMIEWSDEIRKQDCGYFCRLVCEKALVKPIWIVSDIRRKTDIMWFKENYIDIVRTIRINADEPTRVNRGFKFIVGVDDIVSECDLDDIVDWDLIINNSKNGQQLQDQLASILRLLDHL